MWSSVLLVALAALGSNAGTILTGLPSSATTNSFYVASSAGLAATSYSYTFTVTTATTAWSTPTFAAAPTCASTMCPSENNKQCVDSSGNLYGVICDQLLYGVQITNSGKMLMERDAEEKAALDEQLVERGYSGDIANCMDFCEGYTPAQCNGLAFQDGYCFAYSSISGTYASPGGVVALRL